MKGDSPAPMGASYFDVDGTLVTWEETLDFPWWVGGPPGAIVARFVLSQIWKGNLRRLASLIETPGK